MFRTRRFYFAFTTLLLVSSLASADTLKVGTRFPAIDLIDAATNELSVLDHSGNKRILFVFASW